MARSFRARGRVSLAFALVVAGWLSPAVRADEGAKFIDPEVVHRAGQHFVPISGGLGLAEVVLAIRPDSNGIDNLTSATIEIGAKGGAGVAGEWPMIRVSDDAGERFVARVKVGSKDVRYRFTFGGPKGERQSPWLEATIAPAFETPDWAKGIVWYQIFPERFRNGNPQNDPHGRDVFLARWNADWYAVQEGELEAWKARRGIDAGKFRAHPQGPLYNVIWDRRYGGDLQGIVQKLDELKALGVGALYLNPIFEGQSLHKYDASDFRHIDRFFGAPAGVTPAANDGRYEAPAGETLDPKTWTWTPADRYFIDVFLPECKKRGLRVIIDGVWNHVGRQFWAFQDVMEHGRKSVYADWFQVTFDAEGKVESWVGWPDRKNGELPQFQQFEGNRPVMKHAMLAPGPKEHVFNVTRRWMDPNGDGDPSDGVDGWRLDVAAEVGPRFWQEWHALVRSINPDAITVAEIWSNASSQLKGDSFTTQMHYPFAYPTLDWLVNMDAEKRKVSSDDLGMRLARAFPDSKQTNLVAQTLLASHDTDRYVNMLWNPGRHYDRDCAVQEGALAKGYKAGRPPEEIYRLSVLGVAMQAAYVGSPMVYYGDELGMWGADDPTCRKPVPWGDTPANDNKDDAIVEGLRERYASWLTLRRHDRAGEVLRLGGVRTIATGDADVFAFERYLNDRCVVVVLNRGSSVFDAAGIVFGKPGAATRVGAVSAKAWLVERGERRGEPVVLVGE